MSGFGDLVGLICVINDSPTPGLPFGFDQLRRYYAGTSDATERSAIEAWALESPRNAAVLAALAPSARDLSPASQWDAQRAYRTIMLRSQVHASEESSVSLSAPISRRPGRFTRFAWIGAVAMAMGVGFLSYDLLHRSGLWTPWNATNSSNSSSIFTEAMTTRSGERAEMTLSDGTSVILAPGTTLRFSRLYGDGKREIDIDGEAVFTVIADKKTPFVVHTPQTSVTVLGTKFSIRGYSEDAESRVVVASGKVRVGSSNVLGAGSAITVVESGQVHLEENIDANRELSWTDGNLVFENATVATVLNRLSRWHGVSFELDDPVLAEKRVKIGFAQSDVQETINILTTVLGVDASRSDRVVTLRSRRIP